MIYSLKIFYQMAEKNRMEVEEYLPKDESHFDSNEPLFFTSTLPAIDSGLSNHGAQSIPP